jgi:negative regulator of flagellin synthesis FlgM
MTPMRPIDNSPKTPAEMVARRGRSVAAGGGAAPSSTSAASGTSTVSDSLSGTNSLIAGGRDEISRVDREQLLAIKTAIQDGTFSIDPEALADRILSDAFGSDS